MVTLLTYVNPLPTPEEEKDADPSDKYKNFPQGVLEFIARKSAKKGNPSHLQKEPDWRKKDETILFNVWTDLPQPELKIENWGGYDQLYKGELKLEECSFEQMVTLLMYVNPLPTPEEEKDADPSDKYKNF